MDGAGGGLEEVRVSIRAISSVEDRLAPLTEVETLLGFFTGASIEHRVLQGEKLNCGRFEHLNFFRPDPGQRLWLEMADWLKKELHGSSG